MTLLLMVCATNWVVPLGVLTIGAGIGIAIYLFRGPN
jgi:hypothetical protein